MTLNATRITMMIFKAQILDETFMEWRRRRCNNFQESFFLFLIYWGNILNLSWIEACVFTSLRWSKGKGGIDFDLMLVLYY
jgi:hypothetical protein